MSSLIWILLVVVFVFSFAARAKKQAPGRPGQNAPGAGQYRTVIQRGAPSVPSAQGFSPAVTQQGGDAAAAAIAKYLGLAGVQQANVSVARPQARQRGPVMLGGFDQQNSAPETWAARSGSGEGVRSLGGPLTSSDDAWDHQAHAPGMAPAPQVIQRSAPPAQQQPVGKPRGADPRQRTVAPVQQVAPATRSSTGSDSALLQRAPQQDSLFTRGSVLSSSLLGAGSTGRR